MTNKLAQSCSKKEALRKLLVLILFLLSCDPADNRLNIRNISSSPIYYTYSAKGELDENEIRIGMNIDSRDPTKKTPDNFYLISPKSTVNAALTSARWESIANESKDGKVYFFFFLKDTLIKYTWKEIVKGNKYAGKISYTIKDLKAMNWEITCPVENNKAPTKRLQRKEKEEGSGGILGLK